MKDSFLTTIRCITQNNCYEQNGIKEKLKWVMKCVCEGVVLCCVVIWF